MAGTPDQRLLDFRAERQAVKEQFDSEQRRCKASAPHPYASCQARYLKFLDRLEEIDQNISRLQPSGSMP